MTQPLIDLQTLAKIVDQMPQGEQEPIQTVVRVTCGQRNFNATLPSSDYQRIIMLLSEFAYTRLDELESQAPAPLPAQTAERKWIASGMTSYTAEGDVTGYVNPPAAPPERVSEGKEP